MDLCSTRSRELDEPLAGSAPQARLWVLVEQAGPWGRDAVTQSHLDPVVGRALVAWAADHPVRLGLIRRPGRHADAHRTPVPRTVLLARCDPGHTWLRRELMLDPRELLEFNVGELLNSPAAATSPSRALLVCTNAKRDRCCALLGRALAREMALAWGDDVWETSHLGGHRFAPTVVSLPDGYLYGGPDAGALTTASCRGRSSLPPEGQAAELAVLRHLGASQPWPLQTVNDTEGRWHVFVDGEASVIVEVSRQMTEIPRPESCVKDPTDWSRLTTDIVGEGRP